MSLDFQIPTSATLKDIDFAVNYHLLSKGPMKATELSQAISTNVKSMILRANESGDRCHDGVVRFFNMHRDFIMGKARPVSPMSAMFSKYIDTYDKFETFLRYMAINPAGHMWAVSVLPDYFFDHPVEGLKTELQEFGFDDFSPDVPTLSFSRTNLLENTMVAGYIKEDATVKIRVAVPRYDRKWIKNVEELLKQFTLNISTPQKAALINDMQHYDIVIKPTKNDLKFHQSSNKAKDDFVKLYHKSCNGKKYILALDGVAIGDKGFKSLDDVQSFLDKIANSIQALDQNKKYLFLTSMLPLLSVTTKGTLVSLEKFKFNYAKAAA